MTSAIVVIVIIISTIVPGLVILSIRKRLSLPSIKAPVSLLILCLIAFVLLGIFLAAYYFVGPMILFYMMFAAMILTGPILLFVGLWKLNIRLYKLLWCRAEAEGHIVDYILSPWKHAPMNTFHHHGHYASRWFPVVEYEVEGQRFQQKSKICIVCNKRPEESTTLVRYNPHHPARFYLPNYANEFSFAGWTVTVLLLYVGGGLTFISLLFISSWMAHSWDLQSLIQMQ